LHFILKFLKKEFAFSEHKFTEKPLNVSGLAELKSANYFTPLIASPLTVMASKTIDTPTNPGQTNPGQTGFVRVPKQSANPRTVS
jgi:hypothetical protein